MKDRDLIGRASIWIATGLGVGLVAPAPGTLGGLWGVPLAWTLAELDPFALRVVLLALVLGSVAVCSMAANNLGGSTDPQSIVLDEIVALPIVFLGLGRLDLATIVAGFLLFRVFDISKPWPVKLAERLPSGWGIVADDLVAAIFAWLSLRALLWLDGAAGFGWLGVPT